MVNKVRNGKNHIESTNSVTFLKRQVLGIGVCLSHVFIGGVETFPTEPFLEFGNKKYSLEAKPGEYGKLVRNSSKSSINFT